MASDGEAAAVPEGVPADEEMVRTAILHGKRDIRIEDRPPPPAPSATDLIIKPEAVGICGSDFSYYCKCNIGGMDLPFPEVHDSRFGGILGHECSGTVLKVGSAVADKFAVGDRVAIEPGTPCSVCARCREGRYNLCPDMRFLGSFMSNYPGALRTKMAHPAEMCYKIPDHVSFEEAAMLEPMAVATQAVKRAQVKMGDKILIAGAGPVGFLTMLVAKAAGATRISLTDINANRLAFAKDYGEGDNCETFDVTADGVVASINDDFDIAIDCTGVVSSTTTCIEKLRKGGVMVLVGMGSQTLDIAPLINKELDMRGVFRYCNTYPSCLELLATGKIDVKPMITHHFALDQINEAIDAGLTDPTAIKVIVHPNQ